MMSRIRLATWNIHKGVNGIALRPRLEIHNIAQAIAGLEADIVCLQEVRKFNSRQAQRFAHWPSQAQADFLAPPGYFAVYETNAQTRDGEHGNAVLTRWPVLGQQRHDVSDHRFEQRGLLHVRLQAPVQHGVLHVIVAHLGLFHQSRLRQIQMLQDYLDQNVPAQEPLVVAGDFNDWAEKLHMLMQRNGLSCNGLAQKPTFPSRLPVLCLDRIYARGLHMQRLFVPRGRALARMSDHLPLMADLQNH